MQFPLLNQYFVLVASCKQCIIMHCTLYANSSIVRSEHNNMSGYYITKSEYIANSLSKFLINHIQMFGKTSTISFSATSVLPSISNLISTTDSGMPVFY